MSSIKETVVEVLQNPKTGVAVSTTTTGSGLGTVLDLIPNDIGKLATVVGILLSLTIIYVHIARLRMDKQRNELELEILRQKER